MAVNKTDLAKRVATDTGEPVNRVTHILRSLQQEIEAALIQGEDVRLTGTVSLGVRIKPATRGYNPHTGTPMAIPARLVPFARVSHRLKEAVRD